MRDTPNCKICKLKCHGCSSYDRCAMHNEENGYKIEDCDLMASRYYLLDEYLHGAKSWIMNLCKFEDDCRSLFKAWE
jgi:hypothetical protein